MTNAQMLKELEMMIKVADSACEELASSYYAYYGVYHYIYRRHFDGELQNGDKLSDYVDDRLSEVCARDDIFKGFCRARDICVCLTREYQNALSIN